MAAINNLRTLATYRDQKPTGRGSPKRHPDPPFFSFSYAERSSD